MNIEEKHFSITSILKKILSGVSALILAVLCFILVLPVVILPLVTATPLAIWAALIVVEILVLVAAMIFRKRLNLFFIVIPGLFTMLILSIIVSQLFAATPPILGDDGKPLAGSIATMEQVELNGSKQWITIRGKDTSKPVLLYLGIGGPGAGGFPATSTSLTPLEDDFVVVNWDQPGTGKSYNARPIDSLNTQVFVDDAYALTQLMRVRFEQEKIYVMGLSWGTIVGINLIQQHPELYHAYMGNGQMVNTVENDRFGYHLAVELTGNSGQKRRHATLIANGEPPYSGKMMGLQFAQYNNVLFEHMNSPNIWMIMALVPQLSKEYGYVDKFNFDRGLVESFQHLYPQLNDLNFITQAPKLEVPVYFLVGSEDVNAVASIVERYFNVLEAPKKELIWLESGHGATAEELEDVLVNKVLSAHAKVNDDQLEDRKVTE